MDNRRPRRHHRTDIFGGNIRCVHLVFSRSVGQTAPVWITFGSAKGNAPAYVVGYTHGRRAGGPERQDN
jgi:hypothetical protein